MSPRFPANTHTATASETAPQGGRQSKPPQMATRVLPIPPLVANVDEAAAILGFSPVTIRKYCRAGKLARVRGTRRVLIPIAELQRWVRDSAAPIT